MWIVSTAKTEPELAGVSVVDLVDTLTLWMFRGLSSKALSARLSALAGAHVPSVRVTRKLKNCGELLWYKVFIAYCFKHKLSMAQANVLLSKWDLPDSFILGYMLLKRKTASWIKRSVQDQECLDPAAVRKRIDAYVEHLSPWLGRFVNAKLRFIAMTQRVGLTTKDLGNDLWVEALKSFALTYPVFESQLHAINVLKRTMHNSGINLIKHYTRKKNSGTLQEGGMNVSRIRDIADAYALEAEVPSIDAIVDVRRVTDYYCGRKKAMLDALSGKFLRAFSTWLNSNGRPDNDELYDKLAPEKYFKLVVAWLGVRIERAQAFIRVVQRKLAPYNSPMVA